MRITPYKGYALYEPDASPDLTESGEYNTALMAVDADMHGEEQARIDADTALNIAIANEMAQRRAADDALNKRIDTAETEISANSADLTGIKSLTYGDEHVQFLEHDNGSYSSPALDEIKHEISDSTLKVFMCTATGTRADTNLTFDIVQGVFANSVVIANEMYLFPFWTDNKSKAIYTGSRENTSGHCAAIVTMDGTTVAEHLTTWDEIVNKPFSIIGSGLKVESNALTIDASALPSGITVMQLSEFGALTYDDTRPYSAKGEGNDAAYAKLQNAWPNVVVVSGSTTWCGGMYTPVNWTQAEYKLTAGTLTNTTSTIAKEMIVSGSGYSSAVSINEIIEMGLTPDTTWGEIEDVPE